ncbi:hypothetical protein [Achromobacter aloeverae]
MTTQRKLVIGCLRGQGCFFPRTLEQAFGNAPPITGWRSRRRAKRTDWGGAWKPDSHRIPRVAWVGAAAFVLVLFVILPQVGHMAGL